MIPHRKLGVVALMALLLCVALLGCSRDALHNLRRRASFDLGCSEGELMQRELGGHVWGVTGCGRRATYVLVRRSWVLNGVEDGVGGGVPGGVPGGVQGGGNAPQTVQELDPPQPTQPNQWGPGGR